MLKWVASLQCKFKLATAFASQVRRRRGSASCDIWDAGNLSLNLNYYRIENDLGRRYRRPEIASGGRGRGGERISITSNRNQRASPGSQVIDRFKAAETLLIVT